MDNERVTAMLRYISNDRSISNAFTAKSGIPEFLKSNGCYYLDKGSMSYCYGSETSGNVYLTSDIRVDATKSVIATRLWQHVQNLTLVHKHKWLEVYEAKRQPIMNDATYEYPEHLVIDAGNLVAAEFNDLAVTADTFIQDMERIADYASGLILDELRALASLLIESGMQKFWWDTHIYNITHDGQKIILLDPVYPESN